ncbi:LAMI_0E08570g1_1 [Lachancea mirantina]|uniref:LAMI_0E08570g1_1 n=1 Tax=Lachancea mirantina TaxID=1230905 RepID=A0A1G4JN81_9SACH|nr:LAMI_0E08570g1_1 [Lachancea mirantina]
MRREFVCFVTCLVTVSAFAQDEIFEIATNRQDLKWNLFNVFVTIAGAIVACFPFSSLMGLGIPVCIMSTLAALSTLTCLTLKMYDGLIADPCSNPQLVQFFRDVGIEADFCKAQNMTGVSILQVDSWRSSSTGKSFADMNLKVDLTTSIVQNSNGEERTAFCFNYSTREIGSANFLSNDYHQICMTKFAAHRLAENPRRVMPRQALFNAYATINRKLGGKKYPQVESFIQNLYSIFGGYTEELVSKLSTLAQNLEDEKWQEVVITDQIDGVEELIIRIRTTSSIIKNENMKTNFLNSTCL